MTGKDYLTEYQRIKSRISGKKAQIVELEEALKGLKAIRYDLDKVESSSTADLLVNGLIKIEEKNDSIARDIERLVAIAEEITDRIGRMSTPAFMDILTRRYIQGDSFERIAVDMDYSYKTVLNYHGNALVEFEEANKDIKLMEKCDIFGNKCDKIWKPWE